MHGLAEYAVLQPHEKIGGEAATEHPAGAARAKGETRPYVVRDLSWQLARYLDTQDFPVNASAIVDSASEIERKGG